MRVFVTGGSGFIGSRVVDVLLDSGDTVLSFDVKAPIFDSQKKYWMEGDILDSARLDSCLASFAPDTVIHLAARADIYAQKWSDFASIHQGTENLLTAIDRYGKLNKLVNVSTQLVIGPQYTPRSLLDYRSYTMYGEAKAYAEGLILQWQTPVHWFTVRPTNIWGPHHPSFANAIWKYINKRVYLHPDGREPVMRSYGYVQNTAEQIVALMRCQSSQTDRQVFYIADAVMDSAVWVDAFSRALTGKPSRRMKIPLLKTMGWAGDICAKFGMRPPIDSGRVMRMTHSYSVPLERTLALTGTPRIPLEVGVAETVDWLHGIEAKN